VTFTQYSHRGYILEWAEQYIEVNGGLSWHEVKDMPSPAELIASPYDPEAPRGPQTRRSHLPPGAGALGVIGQSEPIW
jgi:hypothetical protein